MSKRVNIRMLLVRTACLHRRCHARSTTRARSAPSRASTSWNRRPPRLPPNTLARGLATQKTSTLGLIVPDIANPFFSEVPRGAEDAAHGAAFNLLLCNTMEDPLPRDKGAAHAGSATVAVIVLCSSRLSDEAFGAMHAGSLPSSSSTVKRPEVTSDRSAWTTKPARGVPHSICCTAGGARLPSWPALLPRRAAGAGRKVINVRSRKRECPSTRL